MELTYTFLDVEASEANANELRGLYESGKLNFPTITIGKRKLRNPSEQELGIWINKLIPHRLPITHDKKNKEFTMDINGELARVSYQLRNDTMYLVHSEVPYHLRGSGIGKVLVTKTFEKLSEEGYEAVAICSFIRAVARRSNTWSTVIK